MRFALLVCLTGCNLLLGLDDLPAPPDHSWAFVVAGDHDTCAIDQHGDLYCWGANGQHQLGASRDDAEVIEPAQVGEGGVWKMAALGTQSGCGVKTSGALLCWGKNYSGQLGLPLEIDEEVAPTAIMGGAATWLTVSTQNATTCAIDGDHQLWCWGANTYGEVDIANSSPDMPTPTKIDLHDTVEKIGVGTTHVCAVTTKGALYCWGANYVGQAGAANGDPIGPTQVAGMYKDVSAGDEMTCALDIDQHVQCFGVNRAGNLGRGGSGNADSTPAAIASTALHAKLAVGWNGACAVDSKGQAVCWGDIDGIGQQPTPLLVTDGADEWAQISVGRTHACGLDHRGTLYCVGDGSSGQLANGMHAVTSPQQVDLGGAPATFLSVSDASTCVVLATSARGLACWGDNNGAELADGTYERALRPVVSPTSLTYLSVKLGSDHGCALLDNSELYCWGNNPRGQLGTNSQIGTTLPTMVPGVTNVGVFAVGDQHTCSAPKGGGRASCWGNNQQGQLDHPTSDELRLVPTLVDDTFSVTTISAGYQFSCFLSSGLARCAGHNQLGQLDQPQAGNVVATTAVVKGDAFALPLFTSLASGREHTCGLVADGTVYCWGRDYEGQLGDGRTTASSTPTKVVTDLRFTRIAAGQNHTCGMSAGGDVACWGRNDHGQLGDGTTKDHVSPIVIGEGFVADAIAAGGDTTCATRNSDVFCWGSNGYGQLGNPSNWSVNFVTIAVP